MRALMCCVSVALVVSGCVGADGEQTGGVGLLEQTLIDDESEPAPEVTETPADKPHGVRHLALTGGRVLRGGGVLRVLDVRDPQHPRAETGLTDYGVAERFFRLGTYAVFHGGDANEYHGERDDVPIPRVRYEALFVVNLSDPANPNPASKTLLPSEDGEQLIVQGPGQAGPALFVAKRRTEQSNAVVRRYELQGDQLVLSGEVEVSNEIQRLGAVGGKVLITFGTYTIERRPTRFAVLDGSGPDFRTVYESTVPGHFNNVNTLTVDGPKLRVVYSRNVPGGDTQPAIDTFDLTKDDSLGRVGRCDIPERESIYGTYFDALLYSKQEHSLFASDDGQGLTYQIPFNRAGKCPLKRILAESSSQELHMPLPQRLLALVSDDLQLFDTGRTAAVPLLASAPLENITYPRGASEPIQVFGRERIATAPDGTPEPWLVALPYYDESTGLVEGSFQLFTASRQTLTSRSVIDDRSRAGELALYDDTLVTLTAEGLRTFDIRDINAPKELGALELDVTFSEEFRFGDYVGRVRSRLLSGWPEEIYQPKELLIDRLDAVGETPAAVLPMRRSSAWLKADDRLLEARWIGASNGGPPYLAVQIYDLSDPGRPRKAETFFTDEIRMGSAHYSEFGLTTRAVGRSLAIAQRQLVDGSPVGPWSVLRVIDVGDPDDPKLNSNAEVHADADFSELSASIVHGTTLYTTHQKEDGLYATRIAVDNPDSPIADTFPVPDPVVAAAEDAVYTATRAFSNADLTLSRVVWTGQSSPPSAARVWPGRQLSSIRHDSGSYLFLTHAPRHDLPQSGEGRSHWARLEVLDATTLETVGALDIDTRAEIRELASGRLFIEIPDALLFVDVRDPAQPRAQAAVPFRNNATAVANSDRIYVAMTRVQSYPIDLQNLLP